MAASRSFHRGSTIATTIGAIGTILVAWSCCLPVLPLTVAAGLAGASSFLSEARPYLLVLSLLAITTGFYQARRAAKCQQRRSRIALAILWASLGLVIISVFFPQLMANVIASLAVR